MFQQGVGGLLLVEIQCGDIKNAATGAYLSNKLIINDRSGERSATVEHG